MFLAEHNILTYCACVIYIILSSKVGNKEIFAKEINVLFSLR